MNLQRLVVTGLCGAALLLAQADNTKRNQRDRGDATVTAQKQGNSAGDREITRKIRKSLVSNAGLSTYAKNVKIITLDGKVTLRGPVNSEEEKAKVASAAALVAGSENVTNELEIATKGE